MRCLRWNLTVAVLTAVCCMTWLSGVALAQDDGRATAHVFPQFADGRFSDGTYYRSTLQISNPSSSAFATCTINIREMVTLLEVGDGATITVGSFTVSMPGSAWGVYRTPGTAEYQSGYATVLCTVPVNAVVIYSYYGASGIKLSEAAVFSSPPGTLLQIISDQREGVRMGIAITNDTDLAATATISAGNQQGQLVGTASVKIAGRSQYVKFLDEMLPVLPADHLGQVLVASSGSQLSIIGLRFSGTTFATIPSSVRQSSSVTAPAPALPTITSVTPSGGNAGATVAITITGTNFVAGATTVSVGGSGVGISSTEVMSTKSINTLLSISSSAAAGDHVISVTTGGGASNGMAFKIGPPLSSFNQAQTRRLLGTWIFSYTTAIPYSDTYRLTDVQQILAAPDEWGIAGTDIHGNSVTAQYSPANNQFLLYHPGSASDRFYAFDFTGADTVSGCSYLIQPHGSTDLGSCYGMTGVRIDPNRVTTSAIDGKSMAGR